MGYSRGRPHLVSDKNLDGFMDSSTVQAGDGDVMMCEIFSWHTLGHLLPIEHRINVI